MSAAAATRPSSPSIFMSGLGPAKLVIVGLLASGCALSTSPFEETRTASGVGQVQARLDSGDFDYAGRSTEMFRIDGNSWGRAFKEEAAEEHKSGNELAIDTAAGALVVEGYSRSSSAGIDVYVEGPQHMGLDLSLDSGDADIEGLVGFSLITADSVDIVAEGGADIFARSGSVDADLYPAPGEVIRIEAISGSVDLTLPYGGSYDLQVWGDPEYTLEIDDLGFHSQALDAGYFAGISGRGDTPVTVIVSGGDVRVRSAW